MRGVLASDHGWTLLVESTSDKIKIETKRSIRENQMARASGPIDYPAKDVWRCMMYAGLRKEWDVNNDFMEHKKKIGVNAYITHIKTIKKFVISAREFVVCYMVNEEPDGTLLICTTSENCPVDIPQMPGIVRGHTALTGYTFKPDPSDPENKCIMSM